MEKSITELLLKYARLGLEHWKRESRDVTQRARDIGVEIASDRGAAEYAATNPFRWTAVNGGQRLVLIPMPCKPRDMSAAFFVPWTEENDSTELSFDLVILLGRDSPHSMAFRFEPASHDSKSTHGYNHAQLSNSLGKRRIPLRNALPHLPTTYPAFPISTEDSEKRFLAMAVAMHGYPNGFPDIIKEVFKGEPTKQRAYLDMTKAMLGE